jgi:hypothetical protein
VGASELDIMAESVWADYGERLARNYGVSRESLRRLLEGWADTYRNAVPEGVSIWTDAPRDYDHGYARRTKDTIETSFGKTLQRVVVPADREGFQASRYQSGMHAAWTDAQVEQEREHLAKRARLAQYRDETRALQKLFHDACDRVPAVKRPDGSYWEIGRPPVYETDAKTGRTYPRPRYDSEAAAPVDPARAVEMLVEMQHRFKALPADIRREEWRLGADAEDVLVVARREVKRLEDARKAREAEDARRMRETMKAATQFVKHGENLGAPGNPRLVAVSTRATGPVVLGKVTAWPPRDGVLQTERGPWPVVDANLDEGPAESVPLAVWDAAGDPHVKVARTALGTFYVHQPPAHFDPKAIYREDGRKVPRNSKAHAEAEAVARGYGSQDAVIDAGLAEYQAQHPGYPGWGPSVALKAGEQAVQVQFHPPVGSAGWRVRMAGERMGQKGFAVWQRLPKRDPKLKVLWRSVHVGDDPFVPAAAVDGAFL